MRTYTRSAAPSIVVTRTLTRSESVSPEGPRLSGLKYAYYEGIYRSVYDFAHDPAAATGVVDQPTLDVRKRDEWFGLSFDGLIRIPRDGNYTFYVSANDGCQLLIDGEEQFESDGRKSEVLAQQSTIALREGFHRFQVKYYQCSDKSAFTVEWSGPNIARVVIPKNVLFHAEK